MKKIISFCLYFTLLIVYKQTSAQNFITTNDTEFTNEELITKVLAKGQPCITNIKFYTGTQFNSVNGIGYFNQNNSSFPLKEGIILSTGNIKKAPGPKTLPIQAEGNKDWILPQGLGAEFVKFDSITYPEGYTQEEIQEFLQQQAEGNQKLYGNTSFMEFDFIATKDELQLKYIYASELYGPYQCVGITDVVFFKLTNLETNEIKYLSTVPGGNAPLAINTLKNKLYNSECESVNEKYFGIYSSGEDNSSKSNPINFRGQSVPIVAKSGLHIGQKYRLTLSISSPNHTFLAEEYADFNFPHTDAAVFIESNIFGAPESLLPEDKLIETKTALCSEQTLELDTKRSTDVFDFQWYKDGLIINGQQQPKFTVQEAGTYMVKAKVKNSDCYISDTIKVEKHAPIEIQKISNQEICTLKGIIPEIDLTNFETELLTKAKNKNQLNVRYFLTEANAKENKDPLANPRKFKPDAFPVKVFIRIEDKNFGCFVTSWIEFVKKDTEKIEGLEDLVICVFDGQISPVSFELIENKLKNRINTNIALSYHLTQEDALNLEKAIAETKPYQPTKLPQTIFVSLVDKTNGCQAIGKFQIKESPQKEVIAPQDITSCNAYILTPLNDDHYYSTEKFGKGKRLVAGEKLLIGKHIVYINTENQDGCVFSKKQEIEVIDCSIAKGISPNADGLNDSFDLTNYHPKSVHIFNRFGKEVYSHGDGYTNQWHGQSNGGQKLSDGTYFYKVITATEELTGYVELLK